MQYFEIVLPIDWKTVSIYTSSLSQKVYRLLVQPGISLHFECMQNKKKKLNNN